MSSVSPSRLFVEEVYKMVIQDETYFELLLYYLARASLTQRVIRTTLLLYHQARIRKLIVSRCRNYTSSKIPRSNNL